MENASIKNGKLYIDYSYYSVTNLNALGYRDAQEIIEVDDIQYMEIVEGIKGGDHGWTIFGKEESKYPTNQDGRVRLYEEIFSLGGKHTKLRVQVVELLEGLKIPVERIREEGSGPAF